MTSARPAVRVPPRSTGSTTVPRASSTWSPPWTSACPPPACTRTSSCRPLPGTRRTTSTPPTCTPSSIRCRRPPIRPGKPRATGRSTRPSPRSSPPSPKATSAWSRTWSRCRCCTTPPPSWRSRSAATAMTGRRASASRCRDATCRRCTWSSATTRTSTASSPRSVRCWTSWATAARASAGTPRRK